MLKLKYSGGPDVFTLRVRKSFGDSSMYSRPSGIDSPDGGLTVVWAEIVDYVEV